MKKAVITFLFLFAAAFQANAAIIDTPNLQTITFYEKTGGLQLITFGINDASITTYEAVLNSSTDDFSGAGSEYYDVFYSDFDGTFNPTGDYITIEAVFNYGLPNGGGLNITAVSLNFSDLTSEFADTVTNYVALGDNASPESYVNAVDGDIYTNTTMGNTIGQDSRLALTVAFPSVPEPATVSILAIGFLLMIKKRKIKSTIHP